MSVVHIMLLKFCTDVSTQISEKFAVELKALRKLPCVLSDRRTVRVPSITDPINRSKGYHYALTSYHKDRAALEEYQASKEHHHITSIYMWPYKEDATRFDLEADEGGDSLCALNVLHGGLSIA